MPTEIFQQNIESSWVERGPLIDQWRQAAWKNFLTVGLPGRNLESWHYTDLQKHLRKLPETGNLSLAKSNWPKGVEAFSLEEVISGRCQKVKAEEFQNQMETWADALKAELGGLYDLAMASARGARVLWVHHDQPVTIELNPDCNWFAIWVSPGQKLEIVDRRHANQQASELSTTLIHMGENSQVWYLKLAQGQNDATVVGTVAVKQQRDSQFHCAHLLAGGQLMRENIFVQQNDEGASCQLADLRIGKNKSQLDVRSVVEHLKPNGKSQQRSYALLDDESRGIFNGRVLIARDAQQVAAGQLSQSLVLSKSAEADTKPELEIYADNVKAAHGATVGQLDRESLFYLQSRGLSETIARRILSESFAEQALSPLATTAIQAVAKDWLRGQI